MVAGVGWADIELKDLMEGDLFRLFEPDGTPVAFGGKKEYYAASKPKPNSDGLYSLEVTNTLEELEELQK